MHIRYSALTLAITAALSTCIFVKAASANAGIKAQVPAGLSHGRPHFRYPSHAKPNTGSVLYDQTGTAENGAPVQDFQSSLDVFDSEAADDFVVTDAAGWSVSAFNFQVIFIDDAGLPTAPPPTALYNIDVYADAANIPGTLSCSYTGVTGTVDATNTNLTIALPSNCSLAQGAYWLSVTPVFDYAPQAFWSNASGVAIGNAGVWRNPSGGFGTGCAAWSELSTCTTSSGFTIGAGNPNYLFQVVGAVGAAAGCNAGELCLVSTVGADTSAGACGASDTIDATVGDQLNFCYTITNNTGVELDYQTLQNNIDGTLLSQSLQALPSGGTYQFNHIETVGATNTYNATWTAQDIRSGFTATVESGGSCLDRIFADGFDGATPACGAANFVDVTGTGLSLALSDSGITDVSMPFSFNFFGTTSNVLTVSNNGGVIFNSPGAILDFLNESLPAGNLPGPAILPLWDDFDAESGAVYTDTRGVSPNRQFIVEWFNRVHFDGTLNTDGATFELILNEDGTMQFEYADVGYSAIGNNFGDPDDCTDGVCATIGLQNDTSLFNPYSAFQASVTDNSGIKWTPAAPQIFTAGDTVTVSVGAPQIVVNPNTLTGTVAAGGTSSILFSIENHGDRDLDWTTSEAAASNLHFPPPGTRFAMPLGDPAKSTLGRAPIAASTKGGQVHSAHVPLINNTVPTFAADIFQNNIETFDALAPQTIDIIAPSDGTPYVGGAFIDGDFSKLYVIAGDFGANPNNLYTIDTTTGSPTLIGSAANAPGEGYSGLAYDTTSGNLYAATANCQVASHLWTIDPATATPAGVGEITGAPCIVAIAVNAQGEMYGLDIVTDALYAIDKSNGNAALIGSIGFNAEFAQDMAFDLSTGVLYLAGLDGDALTDSIYTIDLQTGAANIVGPIGASLGEVDAMGIETVAGPCMQPQDLPWLSLSPIAGTTPPLTASPITASIDGTGSVAGDTLSGTVCVTSNDPVNHTVATPITITVTP